jgi:sulfide:quinone oxidoreductase
MPPSATRRTRKPLRVVIAGGGVAGLEALLALRALAGELVELVLVAPEVAFSYRPLSVAEPFGQAAPPRFELAEIAAASGARHVRDALDSVDAERHRIRTRSGQELEYGALLVAAGAVPLEALPGTLTFRGAQDAEAFRRVLEEAASGLVRRLAFAVPGGVTWPLPLYELALQSAADLSARQAETELILVTHEDEPLGLFGSRASTATASLLSVRGIAVLSGRYPSAYTEGRLELIPDGDLAVDRVVALPRLHGPAIPGLPHTADGFTPIDGEARVQGLVDVYAAGDMTAFPLKQGGIAAQQADAAAEVIAAEAGADVTPEPFSPVLRGLLLTGAAPRYMSAHVQGGRGETSVVEVEPLWWPPGKIVGRYLAPFLAEHLGEALAEPPAGEDVIPVAVDLD